jgi:hypothetical protein
LRFDKQDRCGDGVTFRFDASLFAMSSLKNLFKVLRMSKAQPAAAAVPRPGVPALSAINPPRPGPRRRLTEDFLRAIRADFRPRCELARLCGMSAVTFSAITKPGAVIVVTPLTLARLNVLADEVGLSTNAPLFQPEMEEVTP